MPWLSKVLFSGLLKFWGSVKIEVADSSSPLQLIVYGFHHETESSQRGRQVKVSGRKELFLFFHKYNLLSNLSVSQVPLDRKGLLWYTGRTVGWLPAVAIAVVLGDLAQSPRETGKGQVF